MHNDASDRKSLIFFEKSFDKVCWNKKMLYLCTRNTDKCSLTGGCSEQNRDCGIFVASESRRIYSYAERSRKSRSFEEKNRDCGIFVASESRRIYSYAERSRKSRSFEETAEIAQLVEHNLAPQ